MADNTQLKPLLQELETGAFAVLDGAQFDDLPAHLFDLDFVHRSLYLDRGNASASQFRTAPQLVWLDRDRRSEHLDGEDGSHLPNPDIVDRLLSLVGERPAVVFWQCAYGGEVLYRHLRGINKILIPQSADMNRGKPYEANPISAASGRDGVGSHELVLFRHADSNVMAQVMLSLEPYNLARALGPAEQIIWAADTDWNARPYRMRRDEDLAPPPGTLKLGLAEIRRIEDVRIRAALQRRVSYLRQTCASETAGLPDQAIFEHIRISNRTGNDLGLVSEGAQCRWAFIMCKTNGRVLQSREALDFITKKGQSPDGQVKRFMADAIDWMKSRSSAGAGV